MQLKNFYVVEHFDNEAASPAPPLCFRDRYHELMAKTRTLVTPLIRWGQEQQPRARRRRRELEELLDVFVRLQLNQAILETNLGNGRCHLLWLERFEKIASISTRLRRAKEFAAYADREKSTIIVGIPWEMTTIKAVPNLIRKLDALVIDQNRYEWLMPCYVMYSKLVRPGGVVAILNALADAPEHQLVRRFIEDLQSGYVDGYKHKVHQIQKGGPGIVYEIRGEHLEASE